MSSFRLGGAFWGEDDKLKAYRTFNPSIDNHNGGVLLCLWRATLRLNALKALTAYRSPRLPIMIAPEELELRKRNSHDGTESREKTQSVLLAEDDPALRRYLEVVLERAGYEVSSAADGLEAMKLLLTKPVDAVITDAVMPNLDGYELCRFVRNSSRLSHLPIVLLSALDQKNATSENEHVNAFLAKPVSPEDLLTCLATLLVSAK